ncbi:hypothetical protein V4R08_15425 [Nitrobacter sp. NHB1]|uniref:hypothetical protein n=1 Tax=Nitrobacter sp. NHB1 TaxID=3119830 RepID=UPI002FFFC7B3
MIDTDIDAIIIIITAIIIAITAMTIDAKDAAGKPAARGRPLSSTVGPFVYAVLTRTFPPERSCLSRVYAQHGRACVTKQEHRK